jgi:diketogulonate reductase-like aldo/keto reductase
MPALGLGVFQIPPEETALAVTAAIESGYRLIDTAAVIGNEREVGEGIRLSGIARSAIFVTTKLWIADYEDPLRAFESSLRRLALDYVDLYLLHEPVPTDFAATVAAYRTVEQLLADGRVRAIGVCNFDARHLEELMSRTDVVPAVNQVELHPFFTQRGLRAFNAAHGIVTQAWSPLCGAYVYGELVESPLDHPTILELARMHARTPAQVVLRWHLEHGHSAIPKSARADRIKENSDVFDFTLTPDEIAAVDALDTGVRGGPDPETIDRERYSFKVPD